MMIFASLLPSYLAALLQCLLEVRAKLIFHGSWLFKPTTEIIDTGTWEETAHAHRALTAAPHPRADEHTTDKSIYENPKTTFKSSKSQKNVGLENRVNIRNEQPTMTWDQNNLSPGPCSGLSPTEIENRDSLL
jgi:hypothetical protein